MPLKLSVPFCPFSTRPGTAALVPGTDLVVRAFPARIETYRLSSKELLSVQEWKSAPKNFSIQVDLKKASVTVFASQRRDFIGKPVADFESVYLGCDKAQDIEKIWHRKELRELLPLFLGYAQHYRGPVCPHIGAATLIDDPLSFLCAGFSDLFIPNFNDVRFLGLSPTTTAESDPLGLFALGYERFRAMFIEEKNGAPHIRPGPFPSGRYWKSDLAFSWRKKKLRQVEKAKDTELFFPKECREFRQKEYKGRILYDRFLGGTE